MSIFDADALERAIAMLDELVLPVYNRRYEQLTHGN
jgi:hypothetical protein